MHCHPQPSPAQPSPDQPSPAQPSPPQQGAAQQAPPPTRDVGAVPVLDERLPDGGGVVGVPQKVGVLRYARNAEGAALQAGGQAAAAGGPVTDKKRVLWPPSRPVLRRKLHRLGNASLPVAQWARPQQTQQAQQRGSC